MVPSSAIIQETDIDLNGQYLCDFLNEWAETAVDEGGQISCSTRDVEGHHSKMIELKNKLERNIDEHLKVQNLFKLN